MNVLKKHLEKVIFGIVVILCAVFAYSTWQGSEAGTQKMASLEKDREKIKEELDKRKVSPKYAYGVAAAEKISYKEKLEANLERGTKKVEEEVPPYVAYPTLPRPYVDPKGAPTKESDLTRDDFAEILPLGEVKAEGDHGRVFVTLRPPKTMKYTEAVRIEIFRGEEANKINVNQPYGAVELAPEENPAPAAAGQDTGAAAPTKAPEEVESVADKRRRERRESQTEAEKTSKAKDKKEKPPEEIPAEFADLKVFSDTRVEPRKTYFYQARLLARMTVPEGKRFETKDAAGKLVRILIVQKPKNALPLPGSKPGITLFTTPLSGVASATTPDNFQIRLAGYSGKVDPPGTPEYKRTKDYKARFAVRVWINEAQSWEKKDLEIAPDEMLKGTLLYKPSGSEENKAYPFDSGYKLVELRQDKTVRETEVEVPQVGPDGNLIMDPNTKQPVKVKKTVKSEPIPILIAVLENLKDNKLEEFPERADFEVRAASLGYYKAISERQAAERKALQQSLQKGKDRTKTGQ